MSTIQNSSKEYNAYLQIAEFNEEKHAENITNLLNQVKAAVKVASIDFDQITKPTDSQDFEIKKNFPCLRCREFPIGAVQQCQSCEGLYCAWCVEAVKKGIVDAQETSASEKESADKEEKPAEGAQEDEAVKPEAQATKTEETEQKKEEKEAPKPYVAACCNKECKSEGFNTAPVGKILQSIIESFEFKHPCESSKTYTYLELIQHLEQDCELNKKLRCPSKDCSNQELMTAKELQQHLSKDCTKIVVECALCEKSYAQESFSDSNVHKCTVDLNKLLNDERDNLKNTQNEIQNVKDDTECQKRYLKDREDQIKRNLKRIETIEEQIKKANENLNKAKEAGNVLDAEIPGFGNTNDMIAYDLKGCNIKAHDQGPHEAAENLLNYQRNQWNSTKRAKDLNIAGWVHLKFKKPLVLNAVGLTSGWDRSKQPKDFKIYGKVIRHKGELIPLNEAEFGPVAGFDLLKTVKDERFHHQQNKRYEFDNGAKHLIVSEIKIMIDKVEGGERVSPSLFEIQALF